MSLFTTDYSNTTSNRNEPLPEGDYEFVVNSVQENATKNGAEAVQFDLIVRNDLDQAMPDTNGKYHNRHLWVNEWKRRKTNQYDFKNFQYFMKAAGIPEGTPIDTIEEFFKMMDGKPVRLHIRITENDYNGKKTKVNRPAPWDWQPTQFPQVNHQWKKKPANNNNGEIEVKADNLPF